MNRYKVIGIEGQDGQEFPPVFVEIKEKSHALAKLAAARQVGGYWTEDTEAELITEGKPE